MKNNLFENNITLLNEIFGEKLVSSKLEKLKYIFEQTENSWKRNLERFKNQEIKYLLICEAPPYSETEIPTYFYNQTDRTFNKTIWKTFFPNENTPNFSEEYYVKLAEKGFLLIDNLPFSMKYDSKHRKKLAYQKLIENSLNYFFENLNQQKIKISDNLKIAFGFKLNAIQFIKITEGNFKLKNGKTYLFNEDHICANGSGFPDSKKLSRIFFDEFSIYKYFNGEKENPYFPKNGFELDFQNPKSLFWYYEEFYHHQIKNNYKNLSKFLDNLIKNKLSEFYRDEKKLWEMYFSNSPK